jgi:pseudouridine-5'-phosphate glycosidase
MKPNYLFILPEVQAALDAGRPVVALESTIIAHGMPYPDNVTTAKLVESVIRDHGAVPATIAIMNGVCKVGLTEAELEDIARAPHVAKVSRRDIGHVISTKTLGATTVASTMYIASLAGIKVFVTGGIGGVHRGGETTMDISADLEELSQTGVAVVCAGAKSILDLPLTLEVLETKGVPVIGYQTDVLPAFYTKESDIEIPIRMDSPVDIAALMNAHWNVGIPSGVLIANPIPDAYSMSKQTIDHAIEKAIQEAKDKGITGKEVSPFLLSAIKEITGGSSLKANIELVLNNAKLGSQIAIAYQKLQQ